MSRLLLLLAATLALVGCSHYRLGTEAAPAFATLHVAVVKSDALVPQAQALVTTQLREAFIKDARVRLVDSADEADATLTVTLDSYFRGTTVSRPDDTGLARRFELTLAARATLVDQRTNRPIFEGRTLSAKRGVFTDSGQLQSEYETLPLLATDLANKAVSATLDVW